VTQRPYGATRYELFLARPRQARLDWHALELTDLELGEPFAQGLEPMLAVVGAIDAGRLPGRHAGWGAWLGPVEAAEVVALCEEEEWELPPGLEADGSYVLVAMET